GRDTLHDVGTTLTTAQEQYRGSAADVVQANARRLQEAMRTLEEFGKVFHPSLGQDLEKLRYRTYTLERSLVFADQARARLGQARLYVLITESTCRLSLFGTVAEVLAGGAQVVQLREKDIDDRSLLDKAREVRKMTRDAGALFIVNDRPDIAR